MERLNYFDKKKLINNFEINPHRLKANLIGDTSDENHIHIGLLSNLKNVNYPISLPLEKKIDIGVSPIELPPAFNPLNENTGGIEHQGAEGIEHQGAEGIEHFVGSSVLNEWGPIQPEQLEPLFNNVWSRFLEYQGSLDPFTIYLIENHTNLNRSNHLIFRSINAYYLLAQNNPKIDYLFSSKYATTIYISDIINGLVKVMLSIFS